MSIADLVQRLQRRPDTAPEAAPDPVEVVRTVAPGANSTFQEVRPPEPAPMLAIRPMFAPVALFAPETAEGEREAFEERAAIMEFDGGLTREAAEAEARAALAGSRDFCFSGATGATGATEQRFASIHAGFRPIGASQGWCEQGATGANKPAQSCADCLHLTRAKTCREPVAAGLIPARDGFGIAWPGPVHAAICRAFSPRAAAGGMP